MKNLKLAISTLGVIVLLFAAAPGVHATTDNNTTENNVAEESTTNNVNEESTTSNVDEELITINAVGTEVEIADANLKAALNAALGQEYDAAITDDQLAGLTTADLSGYGIYDLSGIEYLTSVTVLDLSDNVIFDVSPLAGLTQLTDLNLELNIIMDLRPLSTLVNITSVSVADQHIIYTNIPFNGSEAYDLNEAYTVDGMLITPEYISHDGTYEDGIISWTNLSKEDTIVWFEFSAMVTIGNQTVLFNGSESLDLVYDATLVEAEPTVEEVSDATKADTLPNTGANLVETGLVGGAILLVAAGVLRFLKK